jgi:hypothetical protein
MSRKSKWRSRRAKYDCCGPSSRVSAPGCETTTHVDALVDMHGETPRSAGPGHGATAVRNQRSRLAAAPALALVHTYCCAAA